MMMLWAVWLEFDMMGLDFGFDQGYNNADAYVFHSNRVAPFHIPYSENPHPMVIPNPIR